MWFDFTGVPEPAENQHETIISITKVVGWYSHGECDANHIIKWGIWMTFTQQRVTLKHECVRQSPLESIPLGSRNIQIVCQWKQDCSDQSKHQGLMFCAILDKDHLNCTSRNMNVYFCEKKTSPEDESWWLNAKCFPIGQIISCINVSKNKWSSHGGCNAVVATEMHAPMRAYLQLGDLVHASNFQQKVFPAMSNGCKTLRKAKKKTKTEKTGSSGELTCCWRDHFYQNWLAFKFKFTFKEQRSPPPGSMDMFPLLHFWMTLTRV